jgi:hypothetical protein
MARDRAAACVARGRAGRERCVGAATVDGVACRPARLPGPNHCAVTWTDAQDRGEPLLGDLPSASFSSCFCLAHCTATHAPIVVGTMTKTPSTLFAQSGQATRLEVFSSLSYHSISPACIQYGIHGNHGDAKKLILPQPTRAGLASMPAHQE